MNKLGFLFDECVPAALTGAICQQEPTVDVLHVGDPGAPPRGTLDPDLLLAAEAMGRVLVTNDRRTIPGHLRDHFAAAHHTAGVMLLRRGFSCGRYAQEIFTHWATTTPDEWVDRTVYIP